MKAIRNYTERWEAENYLRLIELINSFNLYINKWSKRLLLLAQLLAFIGYKLILISLRLLKLILLSPPIVQHHGDESWLLRHYK